jgi:hypothetical protein
VPHIVNSLGMGWVEAEDFTVGYPLYRGVQGTLAIAAIESERWVETVYNLSVANANTYFIGKDKVLVHNAKKGGCPYVAKGVNGNSKLSQKAQHVYEIRNNKTGEVVKTGISGGKISKKGKSYRAESQRRKWGKDDFDTTIIAEISAGPGARKKALAIERSNANGLRPENLINPKYHMRP